MKIKVAAMLQHVTASCQTLKAELCMFVFRWMAETLFKIVSSCGIEGVGFSGLVEWNASSPILAANKPFHKSFSAHENLIILSSKANHHTACFLVHDATFVLVVTIWVGTLLTCNVVATALSLKSALLPLCVLLFSCSSWV